MWWVCVLAAIDSGTECLTHGPITEFLFHTSFHTR